MKVLVQRLILTVTPISSSIKTVRTPLAVLSINAKFYGHFRRSIMAWTASTWSEMKKVSWRVKKRL